MPNRAGLKKVTKTVRGKRGAVRRSYWVRAKATTSKVVGAINRNKGKIALTALGTFAVVAGASRIHAGFRAAQRGVKFAKAAQQAQWLPDAVQAHAAKGYNQGWASTPYGKVSNSITKKYRDWRGQPIRDAQGNVHGRVKRI